MFYFEHSNNVFLVAYHSINEYSEDRIRVPNIVTPANFEEQIQVLASTARIISLQEYLDHLKEGKPIPEKSIVVTFDDGYKDNLTIAAPILRKYGFPATFFIATGYIGPGEMKWEDQLSCMIRRSKADMASLRLSTGEIAFSRGNEAEKLRVIDALVGMLMDVSQAKRQQVLEDLRKQLDLECEEQANVMMTWDDVRQLASTPGFSIGSHTVSHQPLTHMPLDDAAQELIDSKTHLEHEIGTQIELFSYPYGDYNQDVLAAVQRAGYLSAVTIEYGQNRITSNPLALKRVLVPNQRGISFRVGMKLRSSVVGEFLRKSYTLVTGLCKRALTKTSTLRQEEG